MRNNYANQSTRPAFTALTQGRRDPLLDSVRVPRTGTMNHIPFAALPPDERTALLAALQRAGVAPRQVCISRLEPAAAGDGDGDGMPGLTMVSAPGWTRAYESGAGWIVELERDLGSLTRR